MIINPFEDRMHIQLELSEKYDTTDLEDYLIQAFEDKQISVNVDIRQCSTKTIDRFKQFCSVKRIRTNLDGDKNTFMIISCDDGYREMCFVIRNHCYIDENGNVYPCSVIKEKAGEPITNMAEWNKTRKKHKEIAIRYEVEKDDKAQEEMLDIIKKENEGVNQYLIKYVDYETGVCKDCTSKYVDYNKFIYLFNKLNNKFKV